MRYFVFKSTHKLLKVHEMYEAKITKQFGKYGPERVIYDINLCPENFGAVRS